MSSLWGLTKIVVEGDKAKEVYDLLCRAKEDCGREECRYITQSGNIELEFADSVLKVCEDTYGDDGTLLPFLTEYLGKEYDGLFYHISCEADYIGETNDQEGKYFNLEEYEQEIYG